MTETEKVSQPKLPKHHRCWGLTKNLQRCMRKGDWKLFCNDHKFQPLSWFFILVFTVGGGSASIYQCIKDKPDVDALFKRGIAHIEASQDEMAIQVFGKIYEIKPDYPTAAYHYGQLLKKTGNSEKAIAVLESVPRNETHIDLEYMKGWLYYKLNNTEKAKKSISNAKRELTPNDNRFYLADALFILLKNQNNSNDELYDATLKFCNKIDGILEMERSPKNLSSQSEYPFSEMYRFISKVMALRCSAYFLLDNVIKLQFKKGEYEDLLNSFNRAVRYMRGPWNIILNLSEQNFITLLEMVSIALCINPDKSVYSDYQNVHDSLEVIENKNKINYPKISEMAFLIRSIYFDAGDGQNSLTYSFRLQWDKNFSFNEPMYKIIIISPEYLGGKREYVQKGILKYTYKEEVIILRGTQIKEPHTFISACNKNGNCSTPQKLYPVVKQLATQ